MVLLPAFKKPNKINCFDYENLKNAKQNNYGRCMAEFNGHIYVGTVLKSILQNVQKQNIVQVQQLLITR